ncbi:MAG: LemA family protein [Acidobacteriota bacterium]|nr:MAG: LemA family protein [Acidobacteriota bacterium]
MRKALVSLAVIVGLLVVVGLVLVVWGTKTYNRFVALEQRVDQAWADVENAYQRRMDLIPNLVETVKGVAGFEKETYTAVAEARAQAGSIRITPELLRDPQALARFDQAQSALSSALSRLLVTVERYPDLKANQNFLDLQAQLEGTENRIAVARRRFNEAVREYNTAIRRLPARLIAGLAGFESRAFFSAAPGAETAPKVEF